MHSLTRGVVGSLLLMALLGVPTASADEPSHRPPSLVVIFADDLGYGDLACFGHPTIETPQLDRMAREGMRLTQFYSAANVCTPSRAALITGRLPVRNGMCGDRRRVLFPDSVGGLPSKEITLATALKKAGYATGCVGKWHLGHRPEYLPTRHGFDSYFGIPYSNDMDRVKDSPAGRAAFNEPQVAYFNVPLMRNETIIERPADQATITRRYTEEAVRFIRDHQEKPFFLYLAHNLPHVPLFRSNEFENVSRRGLYGDVIEEIDWSVGQILDTLRELKLDQNTLVVFTSDNGPWLTFGLHGGSAGLLRDGKGSTWEGGMRVPAIAWWPGTIPAAQVSHELGSTLDLFATMHAFAGLELPTDRVYDSYDLSPVLRGTGPSPRETVYFYRGSKLFAVRHGRWKAHFITQGGYGPPARKEHPQPVLYNLDEDPSEKHNVADQHADVISQIQAVVAQHRATLEPVPSQLDR